jgi:hypothetical protein
LKNFALGYILALAAWWATLLMTWVQVSGSAFGRLNAPELSAALGALPVVLLLTLFLILYTPFRKSLLVFATASYLLGGWLSLNPNDAAVVNLIAAQTGVADSAGQTALATVSTTFWPMASVAVAALAAAYCAAWAFRTKSIKSRERQVNQLPDDDLWRETSAG